MPGRRYGIAVSALTPHAGHRRGSATDQEIFEPFFRIRRHIPCFRYGTLLLGVRGQAGVLDLPPSRVNTARGCWRAFSTDRSFLSLVQLVTLIGLLCALILTAWANGSFQHPDTAVVLIAPSRLGCSTIAVRCPRTHRPGVLHPTRLRISFTGRGARPHPRRYSVVAVRQVGCWCLPRHCPVIEPILSAGGGRDRARGRIRARRVFPRSRDGRRPAFGSWLDAEMLFASLSARASQFFFPAFVASDSLTAIATRSPTPVALYPSLVRRGAL